MAERIHILPKWSPSAKLHPGWSFDGQYRLPDEVRSWVGGATWPELFPLQVTIESAGRGRLRAQISAHLRAELPCQRCGEMLQWEQQLDQTILLVTSENEQEAEAQWVVEDERVDWQALLGQEVSLSLPDFPRHDDCHLQDIENSQ